MFRLIFGRFTTLALCALTTIACSSDGGGGGGAGGAGGVGGAGGTTPGSGGLTATGGTPTPASGGSTTSSGGTPSSGGSTASGGSGGSDGTGGSGDVPDGSVPPDDDSGVPPGPATDYPGRRWTVPAAKYGMVVQNDVRITMDDGVVLVGDIAFPTELGTTKKAAGPFPVLLTQNPYGGVFGGASGQFFVEHGYIYASVDVRGTSRSAGTHDIFGPREADDGAALVRWAAALTGSDGKVGLHGCSQLGINQIETATRLAPGSPVKAMIPACASGDFYRDTAFDNGIATTVGLFFAGADMNTGGDKAYYRAYWKERDRLARAAAIAKADIPMLLWSGWNEPGAIGSLELYTALQNLAAGRPQTAQLKPSDSVSGKYQVILGDWGHAGGLDYGIQLQWYDTWIKGIDTGMPIRTRTPLHLEELGGPKRWVNATSYPIVETHTALYFSSDEKLSRTAGAAGGDEISWVAAGLPGGSLEYESEAFAGGAMLAGSIAVRLEVESSNANVQLSIDVFDKAPDGTRTKITHGSVLGSLRKTSPEASWTDKNGLPIRPALTLDTEEPLTAGQNTRLDVPLWPKVWAIEPGHQLVVRLATQPPSSECGGLIALPIGCNPTTPQRSSLTGGVYEVHRGGQQASFISLPLLDRGALTAARTAVSKTGPTDTPLPIDW